MKSFRISGQAEAGVRVHYLQFGLSKARSEAVSLEALEVRPFFRMGNWSCGDVKLEDVECGHLSLGLLQARHACLTGVRCGAADILQADTMITDCSACDLTIERCSLVSLTLQRTSMSAFRLPRITVKDGMACADCSFSHGSMAGQIAGCNFVRCRFDDVDFSQCRFIHGCVFSRCESLPRLLSVPDHFSVRTASLGEADGPLRVALPPADGEVISKWIVGEARSDMIQIVTPLFLRESIGTFGRVSEQTMERVTMMLYERRLMA